MYEKVKALKENLVVLAPPNKRRRHLIEFDVIGRQVYFKNDTELTERS